MGSPLDRELEAELERWSAQGLARDAALPAGVDGVDFGSNDYLGLTRHPRVVEAAREAAARSGAGGRAARLLRGGGSECAAAEEALARWLGAEAALLFPAGYQANLGLVGALVGPGDALFSDRLNHASLIDAARLSRAHVQVHAHLDLDELGTRLARARGARRRLVLVESIFSMDGDAAPLEALDELCARHEAWLVVDEAHALGLVGPQGRGLAAELAARPESRIAARVVTGGKALGVGGAFVVGSKALRATLVNRARAFVFTTAVVPALAGALVAAIEECARAERERARALALAASLAQRLARPAPAGAIVPVPAGTPERTLDLTRRLAARGLWVPAVRPPTVPEHGSRLRVVCHAFNTESELDELARALLHAAPPASAPVRVEAEPPGRPLFVVGTDTGIGKTVVSALLLRAALRRGRAAYWKPVQTGADDDSATVRALAEAPAHALLPKAWHFALAASPHEAAAHAGQSIEARTIAQGLAGLLRTLRDTRVVVELAGGLLVPYRLDPALVTQADWLAEARAPLVLVARSGLGTLNHTLLTLEALRARHLEPRALFLVGEPHASNRATLARVAGVPRLYELPRFASLTPAALEDWLAAHDLAEVLA